MEYLQLLPQKTPDWVREQTTDAKGQRLMKLCHQYAKIKQYYSINQFPSVFTFPLAIIYDHITKKYGSEQMPLKIKDDFILPDLNSNTTSGPESGSFATESKYYRECTKDEFSTTLPESNSVAILDTIKEQTSHYKSFDSYKKSQIKDDSKTSISTSSSSTSKEAGVWESDDISPACHCLSYTKSNIAIIWTRDATYRRISDDSIEVFIHQDKSVLIVRDCGRYFNHYSENDLQNGLLRKFTATSIPLSLKNNTEQYYIKDMLAQINEIFESTIEEKKQEAESDPEISEQYWLATLSAATTEKDILDNQKIEG